MEELPLCWGKLLSENEETGGKEQAELPSKARAEPEARCAAQVSSKEPLSRAVALASCPGTICPLTQISAVTGISQRSTTGALSMSPSAAAQDSPKSMQTP